MLRYLFPGYFDCVKDKIKDWLKTHNRTREWLADQVGVSPKTVHNWLSSPQEIPVGKLRLIEHLIQADEAAEAARLQRLVPTAQVFSLEVDLPTFRAYSAASLASGLTLEQWAIEELNAAAQAALNGTKPEAPDTVNHGASSDRKSA